MQEKNAIKTCFAPGKIPVKMTVHLKAFLVVQSIGGQKTIL